MGCAGVEEDDALGEEDISIGHRHPDQGDDEDARKLRVIVGLWGPTMDVATSRIAVIGSPTLVMTFLLQAASAW